jgi:DNA-nicking Smr family endonuclease
MSRRGRILTSEERALWRAYAVAVKPLPGHALPPAPVAAAPSPTPPVTTAPPPAAPAKPRARPPVPTLEVGTQPGGMETRHWRDLRRGRTRPERTLDLHGRRAQEAWQAVRAFLLGAQADGLRCVAVVTGKGPAPEGGVLRRELPHWLNAPELRPMLLGAAHPAPNSGVVHLLLRRRRVP